jgi:formiminotetrahydrofolate cyclodeaminase
MEDLLNELAGPTAAPGAGCAAAWSGALAAALLEMVATINGEVPSARRGRMLRAQLLEHGESEMHSYEPVLAAQLLPETEPTRAERLDQALSRASEAPLGIARAAAEIAERAATVAARSKPAIAGDAVTAVLIAESATRAAGRLVEINLAGRRSDPRRTEIRRLIQRAARARTEALGPEARSTG